MRHQLRRHAHDRRASAEEVPLKPAGQMPAVLDRPQAFRTGLPPGSWRVSLRPRPVGRR
jgi:hypothetical protein